MLAAKAGISAESWILKYFRPLLQTAKLLWNPKPVPSASLQKLTAMSQTPIALKY